MATLETWVAGVHEGVRGVAVQRKRDRQVYRVEEGGRVWFAKRGTAGKRRELEREARNLDAMRAAGVPVVSLASSGRWADATWVVTAAAPGETLAILLERAVTTGDIPGRRALLRLAAELAHQVHAAGFTFPDLSCSHVFVEAGSARLIDVARARNRRARPGPAEMGRDLAALLYSLPYGCSSRADRVRIVREALGSGCSAFRETLSSVDRALRKLQSRTRWRHRFAGASPRAWSALRAVRVGEDRGAFDAFLDPAGMQVVRTLADRENRRIGVLDGPDLFMKVYPPVRRRESPAMAERCAIDLFSRSGIPVCHEEAYGEDVELGSFLVVRGCPGVPLDDLLRAGVRVSERRALCRQTALIWRRMRKQGLRHRDAYPCHVFAARSEGGLFELRLIDLTRAGRAPFPAERWYVKDAAQLWHGAPRPDVTRTDAIRWLHAYFGIHRLDATAKRFARRVAAKERRIRDRQERLAGGGSE